MALTAHQIALLESSFTKLTDDIDRVAAIFYERLFELDPSLQPLFKSDMMIQGRKMMQMLVFAVNALDKPDDLTADLYALGRRHTAYGIKREDYATVGAALLWTVEHSLSDDFKPEMKDAWTSLYQMLSEQAMEGFQATP